MNNEFKPTHVIVATSYEDAEEYGLTVGTEVMYDGHGRWKWLSKGGYWSPADQTTVKAIEQHVEPASLFTEAQLSYLEETYGLKRTEDQTCAL